MTEKLHSELGASVAHRWMACPGSVQLSRGIPAKSSAYAEEGTAAHALLERCLTTKTAPEAYLGVTFDGVEVDEEMVEAVQVFVAEVNKCLAIPGAVLYVERQFDLAALNPPGAMWGTADAVIWIEAAQLLIVLDFKYGQGIVVAAKGNPQLRYYALGAMLSLGYVPETIHSVVVQPRVSHPEGIVRREEISFLELIDFSEELLVAARRTLEPDPPLVPGDWCRFCPAQPVCPKLHSHAVEVAQTEFTNLEAPAPPSPETLPKEVLLRVLEHSDVLESWLRACRTYVADRVAEDPAWAEGQWKLVAKRANRKWADEEAAEVFARDRGLKPEDIFSRKIKTPAQLERLLRGQDKKDMQALTVKPATGVVLAPGYDVRPAVSRGAEFAALPPASDED